MNESNENLRITVQPREIKFHYLTESEMSSLKTNTIVGDIFLLLASVLLAVGFTIKSGRAVAIATGLVCLVVAMIFYYQHIRIIRHITSLRSPAQPGLSAPQSTASGLVSATYGADSVWIDITDRVREALRAGGSVIVTNGLAGQDPLENVPKFLRVKYHIGHEEFTKDFAEGTPIELPAGVVV